MLQRFNADALFQKDDKLLFLRGGKYYKVANMPEDAAKVIKKAFDNQAQIGPNLVPTYVLAFLTGQGFLVPIMPGDDVAEREQSLYARFAAAIGTFDWFGSLTSMALLLASSILILLSSRNHPIADLFGMGAPVAGWQFLAMALTMVFLVAVHEFGHAICGSCYANMVGRPRFKFVFGMPAACIDVTGYCLADTRGRIAISLAGPIFQFSIAAIVLAFSDASGVVLGAKIAMFLAAVNLLPLPEYDGYWIVKDLLGRNPISNVFHLRSPVDFLYSGFLVAVLVSTVPFSVLYLSQKLLGLAAIGHPTLQVAAKAAWAGVGLIFVAISGFRLLKAVLFDGAPH